MRETVQRATGPVVLVAHSLGWHTVAHWAHRHDAQVRAALLVAPPDIDHSASRGAPIAGFGPWPQGEELLWDLLAETVG